MARPKAKKPAKKKPAAKSTKKPAKKPAAKKPAAKKPAAKKPAAKKPAAKPTKKPATKPAAPTKKAAKKPGAPPATDRDKLAEATHALLDSTWSAWGAVDPIVLSHLINPTFMGGPRWPGMRQAYRIVRRGPAVLIASDGLADPYDEGEGPEDRNGVGLELFAITDDPIARPGVADPVAALGATWLHDLVFQTAHLAADHGGLGDLLDELGAITTELYDVKIPEDAAARFINPEGRATVLLTLAAPPLPARLAGPLSPIRLVHIQLLTNDELAFVMAGGEDARRQLVERLATQGVAPLSRLDRPSVT
jgi:hypothetical protein